MEPPPIPLFKSNINKKLGECYVSINLCRNPTLEISYMYDIKTAVFGNGDLKEFILFERNYQMMLKLSVSLTTGIEIQYLCTLSSG